MSRNLILTSGNNLILESGNNLVLTPLHVNISSQGYYRVNGTVTTKRRGWYQINTTEHDKNLVVTGGNLVFESGNNAVLATLHPQRTMRGVHQILTKVTQVRQRGQFGILSGVTRTNRGYHRVGWVHLDFIKNRGIFRIYDDFDTTRRGSHRIYAGYNKTERGYHHIYESYLPIIRRGRYRVLNAFSNEHLGRHFIENESVEGYVVYVGYDELPDFENDPDGFAASLPVSFSVSTPDPGETYDLYIVVRKRNKYNVESQNQQPEIVIIDSNGDKQLSTLSAPDSAALHTASNDYLRVLASYSGFTEDADPADSWNVYLGEGSAPTPGVDTPVWTGSVGQFLAVNIGPYTSGGITYYLAVTVSRSEDGEESVAATDSLTLDDDPATPVPVNSGYEVR